MYAEAISENITMICRRLDYSQTPGDPAEAQRAVERSHRASLTRGERPIDRWRGTVVGVTEVFVCRTAAARYTRKVKEPTKTARGKEREPQQEKEFHDAAGVVIRRILTMKPKIQRPAEQAFKCDGCRS